MDICNSRGVGQISWLARVSALIVLLPLVWQTLPVSSSFPDPDLFIGLQAAIELLIAVTAIFVYLAGRSGAGEQQRASLALPINGFLVVALLSLLLGSWSWGLLPDEIPGLHHAFGLWQRTLLASLLLLHVSRQQGFAIDWWAPSFSLTLISAFVALSSVGAEMQNGIPQWMLLILYLTAIGSLIRGQRSAINPVPAPLIASLTMFAAGELFHLLFAGSDGLAALTGDSYSLVALILYYSSLQPRLKRPAVLSSVIGSECQRHMIDYAPDGILVMDVERRILYANQRMGRMLDYPVGHLTGRRLEELMPDQRLHEPLSHYLSSLLKQRDTHMETGLPAVLRRGDGTELATDIKLNLLGECAAPKITAFIRDMTERKQQEHLLHTMATLDDLTGLPNRMQLQGLLAHIMAVPEGVNFAGALLLLDLDNFRQVNDCLGHEFGDLLLVAVCARLLEHLPCSSVLVRFSGDELVILLPNADRIRATREAEQILAALKEPFLIIDREFFQSASMGIALIPTDGEDVSQLVRKADLALGSAKAAGRRTYEFYDGPVAERVQRRHSLQGMLRHALERDEFHLNYQPRVDLTSGHITGWEALLRWHSPEEGDISPAEFIPVAEESGLILEIGDWVLHQALAQHAQWLAMGLSPGTMAVNLSPRQLRIHDLAQRIEVVLAKTGVPPSQLEIEITETALMEDMAGATRILRELSRMEIKLAMDDFGTGYSSLGYLHTFPFDRLKIDRSFVTPIGEDEHEEVIARTIIVMAHSFGLSVVAEGVETEAQLSYLISNQCEEIQGFLFSRPLPAGECESLMRSGRCLTLGQFESNCEIA